MAAATLQRGAPALRCARSHPRQDSTTQGTPSGLGRWHAHVAGAFGLGISAQVSFLLALRARQLGAGYEVIGLLVGAGAVSAAVTSVSAGVVVDRLGSRRAFVAGALGSAAVAACFVTVTGYWWFLPLQLAMGVMKNTAWLASQGHAADTSTPRERARATGRFSMFSNVGQMLGPVLAGGAASLVGYQWAFIAPATYALLFATLGLCLAAVPTPQTAGESRAGTGVRVAIKLLAVRGIQVALLLSFARLWIGHVYITFYPVLLVDRGIDPAVVGTIVALSGLVATILAPTAGLATRWLSPVAATSVGLACGVAGLAVAPLATTVGSALVTPLGVGIGAGLSLPLLITLVVDAAHDDARGVALGLRGMVNQSAATAAPAAVGALMGALGLAAGFVSAAVLAGIVLIGGVASSRNSASN